MQNDQNQQSDAPVIPADTESTTNIVVEGAKEFAEFEAAQAAAEKGEADKEPVTDAANTDEKPAKSAENTSAKPAAAADAPKKSAQERIRELTRRGKEAERERDAERAEKQALLDRIAALERGERPAAEQAEDDSPPDPEATNADGTPKYRFGELDTAYVRDLAKYEARQLVREERARDEQRRQQQAAAAQAEEAEQAWADQLEAAAATIPDFVEKVFDGGKANAYALNRETFEMAQESDVGAQVLYHLATNPKEALALYKIDDPVERARSFGRLEARFQPGAQPPKTAEKPAKTPKADAPAPQARGTNGQFSVPNDTTDFKKFEAQWQPQLDSGRFS